MPPDRTRRERRQRVTRQLVDRDPRKVDAILADLSLDGEADRSDRWTQLQRQAAARMRERLTPGAESGDG
jgi:uncharacterized Zn finger protein